MGSDLKRKITALLDQVFPEFESQFSSIFGKTALAVLRQYPTPEKLSRAQTGKLTEILQTASNGRFGEWKARQLKELARDSFGIPDCEGAYSTLLLLYLDQFQALQDAAAVLEKRIAELFSRFESASLPSPVLALCWALSFSARSGTSPALPQRINWRPTRD